VSHSSDKAIVMNYRKTSLDSLSYLSVSLHSSLFSYTSLLSHLLGRGVDHIGCSDPRQDGGRSAAGDQPVAEGDTAALCGCVRLVMG